MIHFLAKRASLEDPNVPLGDFSLLEVFGGGPGSAAGRTVNATNALQIAAVYSAVATISGSLASLPLKVYQRRSDGRGKDRIREHPLDYLLNVQTNAAALAANFRADAQGHLLLRGNMVAEKSVNGRGELTGLDLLNPDAYQLRVMESGEVGAYLPNDQRMLSAGRILRAAGQGGDGVRGWSVVRMARETLGSAMAADEYAGKFFANDATPRGILKHPMELSPEAKSALRSHWEMMYGGSGNSHKVAVLEEGMDFEAISMTAEDSQFLEQRNFSVREIARWFNLPPHKIGDLADAKWANIDAQNLEYVIDCLTPWMVRWEQAILAQLFTPAERMRGLFVEHDVRGLLRGDAASRAEYFMARTATGSITPDEIRSLENENPLDEGGDQPLVQTNLIPLDELSDFHDGADDDAGGAPGLQIMTGSPDTETRIHRVDIEERAFQRRIGYREEFRETFLDLWDEVIRGEIREVSKLARRTLPEGDRIGVALFNSGLADYYFGDFVGYATRKLGPQFGLYASLVAEEAKDELPAQTNAVGVGVRDWVGGYTDKAVANYARSSRQQLQNVVNEAEPEAALEAVEQRFSEWQSDEESTTRAERQAKRHANELNQATARHIWSAAGVLYLVSRAIGDSCPYCRALDGRTVGIQGGFFGAGESFQPDGADHPLTFRHPVRHPPYHGGCDCVIRPRMSL